MGMLIDLIESIDAWLIIAVVVIGIVITIAYMMAKISLTWCDTMLERNERIKNDIGKLNNKGIRKEYPCKCGQTVVVWLNRYGQGNTGKGSCKCGAEMYIN